MKLLSAAQMRALDRHCIDVLGIPGLRLMERAGEAVAGAALAMLPEHPGTVLILCGKGNNGGDGLVAARILQQRGAVVEVVLPFVADDLSPDARAMFDLAIEAGVSISDSITDAALTDAGVVIDALLGTGVTGPVHGVMSELITRANAARDGRGVLAVDLPSGVDADTGEVYGPAMHAEATITMALPKPCLVLYPGAALAGCWQVADIGFPCDVIADWPSVGEITEREQAASWLPSRPRTAHKSSIGWALIIAGSFGMTGAAAMAARSAYRSGAGLVRLALPASLVPVLNAALIEVVFLPMAETRYGTLSFHAVSRLLAEADHVQAALIGPGLSRNAATANAVRHLVSSWPGPLVVDADALSAMAGQDALWLRRTAPTIITPHPGEMSRLLGKPVAELERDRLATAREAARRLNVIAVYKGAPTIIAMPDGSAYINPTGNAALAVAGTGDTLAGSIVAFLAQGLPAPHATALACYIGGLACEQITARQGLRGMTSLDLIEGLPYAMETISR